MEQLQPVPPHDAEENDEYDAEELPQVREEDAVEVIVLDSNGSLDHLYHCTRQHNQSTRF